MARRRKGDETDAVYGLQEVEAVEGDRIGKVGLRVRAMRDRRGLTIGRLAELSGVPASTISKIENGRLRPSLVNAINLAQALGENLGFLVGANRDPQRSEVVVRAARRPTIAYQDMGLALQDLSGAFPAGMLEARVGILAPGATSGKRPMSHSGEEFCYVIAGDVRYEVDGQEFMLGIDDYIQFKAGLAHAWRCVSSEGATVLWVFSDGISF